MINKLHTLFEKYREPIMYIIAGVATTAVYFLTRFTFLKLGTNSLIAVIIAQITAITFAYVTNKIFVFRSKTNTFSQLLKEAIAFFSARGLSFLFDVLVTFFCIEKFGYFFIDIFSLDKINYNSGLFSINLVNGYIGDPERLNEFIFAFFTQVVILVSNYLLSKLVIFKKKKQA